MKIINIIRTCDKDARTCTVRLITSIGEFEATAYCHQEDNMYMGVGYELAAYKASIKAKEQLLKNLKKEYRGVCKAFSTTENIVCQNNIKEEKVLNIMSAQKRTLKNRIDKLASLIQKEKDDYMTYSEQITLEQKYLDTLYEKVLNNRQ